MNQEKIEAYFDAVRTHNLVRLQEIGAIENFEASICLNGRNLLHECAHYGNAEVTAYVLSFWKYSINIKDDFQETPLLIAINYENVEFVKEILKCNPDLTITSGDYETDAIGLACITKNLEITRLLLQHGAILNSAKRYGHEEQTLLNLAVMPFDNKAHSTYIEFLIQNGADINASNNFGYTPLIYALIYEDIDLVLVLLKNGANKNVLLQNGRTIQELIDLIENEEIKLTFKNLLLE